MGKRKRCAQNSCAEEDNAPPSKLMFTEMPMVSPPPASDHAEVELRKVMDDFIKVYERLDTGDDVQVKPNYSYTELVYLSILRSPNFCLPITEIYKYIKSRFSFFRNDTRGHWKNAVRHSLSKTKCFTKIAIGRGVKPQGNGNRSTFLWCILPKSIVNFARGDYRPTVDKESGTNTLRWGYYRVNAGQFWHQVAMYLERKFEAFQMTITLSAVPGKIFEEQTCTLPEEELSGDENSVYSKGIGDHDTVHISLNHDPFKNTGAQIVEKCHCQNNGSQKCENCQLDEHCSQKSPYWTEGNDSGNETLLDSSPESDRVYGSTYQSHSLNSSYVSFISSPQDFNRFSPELPDLGHVSSFELSPLPNNTDNIETALEGLPSQAQSRLSPPAIQPPADVLFPSYYDGYHSYYSTYQRSTPYGQFYDPPQTYGIPACVYPLQGSDPMLSTLNLHEWSQSS